MQHRLARTVAMALVRQQNEACGAAESPYRLIEPLALHREGPRVAVGFTMDQQKRTGDFVRRHIGGHPDIDLGRLPDAALLELEPERRQCPVVRAAARYPGTEQI